MMNSLIIDDRTQQNLLSPIPKMPQNFSPVPRIVETPLEEFRPVRLMAKQPSNISPTLQMEKVESKYFPSMQIVDEVNDAS
jgi:hypothetical protein